MVTGGSQGLGLEIARAFGRHGAKVILVARNEDSLSNANQSLADQGIDSRFLVCDVTSWPEVESRFQDLLEQIGGLDVLVNAVGKSTRSKIEDMNLDEAREMMDVNCFSAWHCIKATLPSLQTSRGHIVNIGSLSSKTAWPFMTPYTTSKFALAALTHQLRIELGETLHAMLVCPGPIKREDAGERYDKQAAGLPESARKPGGGAKLKGICPSKLAEKIVRGCEKRQAEIIVPWKARLLFVGSALSARLGDWLLKLNQK